MTDFLSNTVHAGETMIANEIKAMSANSPAFFLSGNQQGNG
jgi:hypothetical protein